MRIHRALPLCLLAFACGEDRVPGTIAWDDVTGKPTRYPGDWADLAGIPATFPAEWEQVANRPATFPSDWEQIANRPATFPAEWEQVANRPATFPTDPTTVQTRVSGSCPGGGAIAWVNEDGSVGCATSGRPVTIQLPAATWGPIQCASVATNTGLAGMTQPTLRFDPAGACGTVRSAGILLGIPAELPAGPRPFRVRGFTSVQSVPGAFTLRLEWRIPTAVSGVGAYSCAGSRNMTVIHTGVQDMTPIEFDFRNDPSLCGEPGDPLALSLSRTDSGGTSAIVHGLHAVFD